MRTRRGRGLRAGSGVGQFGHLAAAHAPAAHQIVHCAGAQSEGRDGGTIDVPRKETAQGPGTCAALTLLRDEAPRHVVRLAEAHVFPVDLFGVAGENNQALGIVRDGGERLAQGGNASFLRGQGLRLLPPQRRAIGVVTAEVADLYIASRRAERVDPRPLMEVRKDCPVDQFHAYTITKKRPGGANRSRTGLKGFAVLCLAAWLSRRKITHKIAHSVSSLQAFFAKKLRKCSKGLFWAILLRKFYRKDAKGARTASGSIGRSAASPLTAPAALRFAP